MENTDPPPVTPPLSSMDNSVRILPVIRDVAIVWLLTAMGGFLVGFAMAQAPGNGQGYVLGIVAANFLFGIVGFTISGCLTPTDRWRHLAMVGAGLWLTSFINVIFLGLHITQWLFGIIFVAIIMGIGGAISYWFKKEVKRAG